MTAFNMKTNDPFNFDDIYASMGAGNLVKKPMAELKKATAAPPPRNIVAQPTSSVQAYLHTAWQHRQPRWLKTTPAVKVDLGLDDFFSSTAASKATSITSGISDPFAAFENVDNVMPVVVSAPVSNTPVPSSSTDNFLGMDDAPAPDLAPGRATTPPPLQGAVSYQSVQAESDYTAAAQTSYTSPAAPPSYTTAHVARMATSPTPQPQRPPRHVADSYDQHARTPVQENQHSNARWSSPDSAPKAGRSSPQLPVSQPSWPPTDNDPSDEHFHYSDESARHDTAGPRHAGIGGFLRDFDKKAVKAAQVGLEHVGHALEKLDKPGSSDGGSAPGVTKVSKPLHDALARRTESRRSDAGHLGGAMDENVMSSVSTKALEMAVRIGELPVEVRGDALAQLPPGLRQQVEELLREQALMEEDGGSGGVQYGQVQHHDDDHDDEWRYGHPDGQVIQTKQFDPLEPQREAPQFISSAEADSLMQQLQSTAPAAAAAQMHNFQSAAPAAALPHEPVADVEDIHDFFSGAPSPETAAPAVSSSESHMQSPPAAAPVTGGMDYGHFQGDHDFFSGAPAASSAGSHRAATAAVAVAAAQPPQQHSVADLLSVSPPSVSTASATLQRVPATAPVSDNHDMGDFFAGGQAAASVSASRLSGRPQGGLAAAAGMRDLMGDLHRLHMEDVDEANRDLYEDMEGEHGEPEIRKQLRAARLAAKHAKMQAALAVKKAMDEEEARRKEEQVQFKVQYKETITSWKNKHKGNIRGLLGSLHTVLWEGSGWAPVSVGDLLDGNQVKKVYRKANLLVHPDKVKQKNGSAEQVAIADMVFDVLKEAWNAFTP